MFRYTFTSKIPGSPLRQNDCTVGRSRYGVVWPVVFGARTTLSVTLPPEQAASLLGATCFPHGGGALAFQQPTLKRSLP